MSNDLQAQSAGFKCRVSLLTLAVAGTFGLMAAPAGAADQQPTLSEPVAAGDWFAARNQEIDGDYDINIFDRLVTGTGTQGLAVEKAFSQADFDAVKALEGFEEFGNYYEDDLHKPFEVGMVDGVFINGADTDVTFENASVIVTGGSLEGNPYVELGGVYQRDGVARFAGAATTIHASTAAAADSNGESWVYGYAVENPLGFAETQREVTFSADKTDISAASTNESGLDAIALLVSTDAVDNPAVSFARGESTLTASTAAAGKSAIALYMHNSDGNVGTGSVTVAKGATLNLVATGGAATGLHIDHGTFVSEGTVISRAESVNDNEASGISVEEDGVLHLTGNAELHAQSEAGHAFALNVGPAVGAAPDSEAAPDVTVEGDIKLSATGHYGAGVDISYGQLAFNGATTIEAVSKEAAGAKFEGWSCGVYADVNGTDVGEISFNDLTITASGGERSVGIYFQAPNRNSVFTINGDLNITVDEDAPDHLALWVDNTAKLSLLGATSNLHGGVSVDQNAELELGGNVSVTGNVNIEGQLTGSGNLVIDAENGSVSFTGANDNKIGNLTVSNADFTNTSNIDVTGTITLNNVKIDNLDDGDVEAKDAIYLGAGTVFRNYGHFDADNWVLLEGSKYLEAYDEGDPDFSNGNMVHDSGRVEFAGGLYGLVSDENALKSWTLTTDREEAAEWGDDYTQPQLVISASEYDWDYVTVDSTATETNALEVTGGALKLGAFNAQLGRAAVTGGEFHADTLNSSGAFTMNVGEKGTFTVGKFVGAEGANFTLASGEMSVDNLDLTNGLLTIAEGANLSTFSGEIFTPGLGEDGKTPTTVEGLVYGSDHLLFADGSTLTIRDQFYNNDYFDSADALLGDVNLVFTGTLVDGSGEVQDEIDYDEIRDGETHANSDISAPAAGADGTVTVDKSVGGKTFVVKDGTSVAVNGDKTLTLVGSAEGGELVVFEDGAADKTVSVEGGLALGVASSDVAPTKGTITSDVTLADGSTLTTTNGEFTLKRVAAEGADITVDSGSLTVESLAVSNDNQLKGTLDADTVTGDGTIRVGSADEETGGAGTLNVETLDHTGIIFIDPAWVDGAEMKDGSFLTVQQLGEDGVLNADVVAGQNSTFVFGATKDDAVKAFAETGLKYGKDADVTAVLYVAKALQVQDGSITVDGSKAELGSFAPAAGSVTIAAKGLALIDAAALSDANVAAVAAKTVDIQKDAQVRIANLTGGLENAVLFDASEKLTVAEDIEFESNDAMINVSLKQDGNKLVYSTEANAASDVFAGFEGSDILQAIYDAGLNNTHSSDRTVAFLSNMAAFEDHGMSKADAIEIGNDAMALAAIGGVYNVALDASGLMNRSIDRRMSVAGTLNAEEGVTFWADVFATRNEAESLYGSSGYSADLYGGVFGADVALGNGKRIGAAVTVGTGDAESEGSALKVDNDADFVGVSLYGSHRLCDFNGKVDFGYMHTKSDLSATAFNVKVGDEVTADAWTVGIGAEYLFNVGSFDIVPHVGIRWTRLDVDGYTGAFKTEDDTMDVFTAPIGVAFAGNFNAGGWKLAPTLDLSIVPNFGDDEATSTVRWNNVKDEVKTQVVDDAPVRASLGLNAQTGDWTIGAAYDLGVGGDDRLDNALTIKARYQW